MQHILAATDLSIRSERALRRAFQIAAAESAKLTVLHVVDEDLPKAIADRMKTDAEDDLARLCASISEAPVEIRVQIGDAVQDIAAAAAAIDAELIVLGVHRPRPFWDMFTGTTLERVVRSTVRPVLLVVDSVDHPYSSILCGIDLSPASAAAVRMAIQVAPKAKVHSFHAVHIPFRGLVGPEPGSRALDPFIAEAQEDLDAWWQTAKLPEGIDKPVPDIASVTESFDRKKAEVAPDLLAIGAHGRPALSTTLLGSFTEEVLGTPPCDVLVVRR